LPPSHSRNSVNRYHFYIYIHVYIVLVLYSPFHALSPPPPPSNWYQSPTPRQYLFCSLIL
jgi:hypothetical protein